MTPARLRCSAPLLLALTGCGPTQVIDHTPTVVVDLEAESGQLSGSLVVASDPAASGGAYLLDENAAGTSSVAGEARYGFSIQALETRDYYLRGRALAPAEDSDSFWVLVDGGDRREYFTSGCVPSDEWKWVYVHEPLTHYCPIDLIPQAFLLAPGAHTLVLRNREGQSAIDRLQVVQGAD